MGVVDGDYVLPGVKAGTSSHRKVTKACSTPSSCMSSFLDRSAKTKLNADGSGMYATDCQLLVE